jgi:hypothetical protein
MLHGLMLSSFGCWFTGEPSGRDDIQHGKAFNRSKSLTMARMSVNDESCPSTVTSALQLLYISIPMHIY